MRRYHVDGMSCAHCTQAITQAVKATLPTAEVRVDLSTKMVTVEHITDARAVAAAIRAAGYSPVAAS